MSVLAIVDCNNFYVSCERVFNPMLSRRPVVVLSNNDGNVVSMSNEAKELGIRMGTPLFKIRHMIGKYGIEVFSPNYALYGDMSKRVMQTLSEFTPEMEIYSIDEAFLDLAHVPCHELVSYAHTIRHTVERWTGIPVAVGIGPTKTLAKVANRLAKRRSGVWDIMSNSRQELALKMTRVEDVWGVGRHYSEFLKRKGIYNALQLRDVDDGVVKKRMGITGLKVVQELRGIPCYSLESSPPAKKGIRVSRTFKWGIDSFDTIREAVASFVGMGAEKLRKEGIVTDLVMVFIMTNRFDWKSFFFDSEVIHLPVATNDTSELISYVCNGLKKIFKDGFLYKKAGVLFENLTPDTLVQGSLFDFRDRERSRKLMNAIDYVNRRFGTDTLKYGAMGLNPEHAWHVFKRRSPSYTTDWDQLPEVS